ncbi:hypothetical protein D9Q98_003268 [Chlorella vulgaris]|uniref:Uncharacterized protein n=1 Tax=Chlorella vulgaris TaxID=3077 RepID=A0A9D4TSP0_CHLVU|nr:hypothetical protein D9Q98_003268 [Chlorella vulgaris]
MAAKLALLALLALAPCCLAHTYFKAELTPHGDQAPDAPDAAAVLDFFTHQGEAMWTLNVTGVEGMSAAKIVYGNPNVYGEEVVTFLSQDTPVDVAENTAFEGMFNATEFSEQYPWTMDGLMANGGLKHLWAVIVSNASYHNILLSGPVLNYVPAGES